MPRHADHGVAALKDDPAREPATTHPELERSHRAGRAFVNAFYLVCKTVGLFDPSNTVARQAVASFLAALAEMLRLSPEATLRTSAECLFVNDFRLRIDFEGFQAFRHAVESLKARQIGAITFREGLTEAGLVRFLRIYLDCDVRGPDPRRQIEEGLRAAGIDTIAVGEPWALPDRPGSAEYTGKLRDASVNTYFKSIFVARQFIQNLQGGRVANFQRLKRLVHTIVDLVAEDDSTLLALTQIKNFDNFLFTHSANVCVLSVALGQTLSLDKELLGKLGLAAMLHDVGMTEIPREILSRRDELSPAEREQYERHPLLGARTILRGQGVSEAAVRCALVALEHHVEESGAGFPRRSCPRPASLLSRVVAVADFYDSVTTPPPEGHATFTPEEALRLMVHGGKDVFDPVLVKLFVNTIGAYPLGTMVLLDTGETGVVYRRGSEPGEPARPMVKITADTLGNPVAPFVVDLNDLTDEQTAYRRSIVEAMAPSDFFTDVLDFTGVL